MRRASNGIQLASGPRTGALIACAALVACGSSADEAGADALWQRIQSEDYRQWDRAPGYDAPQPTIRAHGDTALVFLSPTMVEATQTPGLEAWPSGSIVVKDSFRGDALHLIAAMEKQDDAWFYAEWDAAGAVKYAGTPDVCVNCHSSGDDFILVVPLPGAP